MTPARAGVCISTNRANPKTQDFVIWISPFGHAIVPLQETGKQGLGLKPAADGGGGFRKQAVSVAISLALAARAPAPATPGGAGAIGCNPAAASRNSNLIRSARSGAWFGCTRHRAGRRSRATKAAPNMRDRWPADRSASELLRPRWPPQP